MKEKNPDVNYVAVCLYSSLFFEHYNRILLCDWVLELCSVFSFEGVHVTMHSYFTWAWQV